MKDLAVLLDITGVCLQSEKAIPGSVDAVDRLVAAGAAVQFCTNETLICQAQIVDLLRANGFTHASLDTVTSPGTAAAAYCKDNDLKAFLCIHDNLRPDLVAVEATSYDTADVVVLGDLAECASFSLLNNAFRALLSMKDRGIKPRVISLGNNRFFKDHDCKLSLDVGFYLHGLMYSAGLSYDESNPSQSDVVVIGKPATSYFLQALRSAQVPLDATALQFTSSSSCKRAVMVGDDVRGDVAGSQRAGLEGYLVMTGKYNAEDVAGSGVTPTQVTKNLAHAVEVLFTGQ
eukprot:m.10770 g.10770  ORF g.10770 m.10770 type:complete len:289 (+) comp5616_c0_seq2:1602-2468(+)